MRAPAPFLICAATNDFFDIGGAWETFRCAKRLYTRLGFAERVELMENDAPHNYNTLQRQSVLRWMSRWLLGKDEPLVEPPIAVFTDEELRATPRGQVMLIPGARTAYDFNAELAKELAAKRAPLWAAAGAEERRAKVRAATGIRPLGEIPEPALEDRGDGRLVVVHDDGIRLPVLAANAAAAGEHGLVLAVDEDGKSAALASGAAAAGRALWAVDVRGTGETLQTDPAYAAEFGPNLNEAVTAYLLGRSYVAMRAEDILVCARAAAALTPTNTVDLVAFGSVGVPALHAAALEPQLFSSVRIVRSLRSWTKVIDSRTHRGQFINAVHGALEVYDLPDLAAMLGGKVKIEEPLDARGEPASVKQSEVKKGSTMKRREFIKHGGGFALAGLTADKVSLSGAGRHPEHRVSQPPPLSPCHDASDLGRGPAPAAGQYFPVRAGHPALSQTAAHPGLYAGTGRLQPRRISLPEGLEPGRLG